MEIIHTRNSGELAKLIGKELSFAVFSDNVRVFNNEEIAVSVPKKIREAVVSAATLKNEDWIELFFLLDAMRETERLVLCMPYMGYSRHDVQNQNESFGAGLFSKLLETMNVSHCILVDNHSEPFLRIPTSHISAEKIFRTNIANKYPSDQLVVVSPDIGGAYRASAMARSLGCDFAVCNKWRDVFGDLKKSDIIGNVANKICVLIDDIVDSGSTLCHAADTLFKAGSRGVMAYVTHGVLSKGSIVDLEKSGMAEIVLTDSINNNLSGKFKKLSIASLIAEAIQCIL